MATLARLDIVVAANTAQAQRGFKGTSRDLDAVGRSAGNAHSKVSNLGAAFKAVIGAAIIRQVARGTAAVFELGSAVEETQSKFSTVFGSNSKEVQDFLDVFAHKAGMTNREGQDLLSTTAAIAQGFGFAQKESAAYAQSVATLAGDIASFHNVAEGAAGVMEAINSAAAGERERLKQFGIVIREVEVQQRALNATGKLTAASLTQQEKAAATLELVYEKAGVAVGDLDRTQMGAANTARRVTARIRELGETFASAVLPVMAQLLGSLDDNASAFDAVSKAMVQMGRWINTGIAMVQLLGVEFAVAGAKIDLWAADVKHMVAQALLENGVAGIITDFSDWVHGLPPWVQGMLGLVGPVNPIGMAHGLADLVRSDTGLAVLHAKTNFKHMVIAAQETRQGIYEALNDALGLQGVVVPSRREETDRSGGGDASVDKLLKKVKADLAEIEAMTGIAAPMDLLKERAKIAERAVRALAAAGATNTAAYAEFRAELEHLQGTLDFFEEFNKEWDAWAKAQTKVKNGITELQAVGAAFANDFIDGMSRIAMEGTAAFRGMANAIIADLTRIAIKMAILEIVKSVAPGSLATVQQGLGFTPAAVSPQVTSNAMVLGAGGGGMVVHQSNNVAFSSLDPRTHAQLLREQGGTLAEMFTEMASHTSYPNRIARNAGR